MDETIPRVIHQIWIGPKRRPDAWIATWPAMHPGWRHELWDDARIDALGLANRAQYDAMPELNGKADIARFEILARHGGVYVDADAECLRPLGDDLLRGDSWACWENERLRPGLIATGYLGAVPGCELMRLCVAEIGRRDVAAGKAWRTVGPQLLTDVVRRHRYAALRVLPSCLFLPEHFAGATDCAGVAPYARHHWYSTNEARALQLQTVKSVGAALAWGAAGALAGAAVASWWMRR